jgi:uncharacterized protein (UPF0332 family)
VLDELTSISVDLRLEKSRNCLKAAETLLATEAYADSANRSYYSIFNALQAVLVTVGFSSKTHSGCISEFNKRFVKTGLFEKINSKIIDSAFTVRNKSDYDIFYVVVKSEVVQQVENAKAFLSAVEVYIDSLVIKIEE